MPFTPGQQAHYRPVVERAWQTHARLENLDPKSGKERRTWYESQLLASVGTTTTNGLDKGRDFDQSIAHFEALADDGQTYWQNKAENGDLRRVLWNIFKNDKPEIEGQPVDLAYLQSIAKQMLNLDHLPRLQTLKKSQLTAVQKVVIIYRRRHAKAS